MKFYNSDKLFIGNVGHVSFVRDGKEEYKKISNELITIVYKKSMGLNCEYFDILSKNTYIDFNSDFCKLGYMGISSIMPLSIFILKTYKSQSDNEILGELAKKVLNNRRFSHTDIINLLLYLNDSFEFNSFDNRLNENPIKTAMIPENYSSNNKGMNCVFILTEKHFKSSPAIGREDEIREIIVTFAQERKNPILVGPSGTGKTAIVEELTYKISQNMVPEFLKHKKIIELDVTSLIAGSKYLGTFEEKAHKLIDYVIKNDAILFIDEIHTIYGTGSSDKNDNDLAGIIKQAIDRKGLRVIGTTTEEEYEKYFANDALKRRFEKVEIKEPAKSILYEITKETLVNYSDRNSIKLPSDVDSIINLLINLTNEKHRTWNDKVCNPDLIVSIIDKIFADAKIKNQDEIEIDNIIYGIKSCNRIYDSVKEDTLKSFTLKKEEKKKIIKLEFNNQCV